MVTMVYKKTHYKPGHLLNASMVTLVYTKTSNNYDAYLLYVNYVNMGLRDDQEKMSIKKVKGNTSIFFSSGRPSKP